MKRLYLLLFTLALCLASGCGSVLKQVEIEAPPVQLPPSPQPKIHQRRATQQIQLMAQLSDAYNQNDLRRSYRLLKTLDPRSPALQPYAARLAELERQLVDRWAGQLIAQAEEEAHQHRFTAAITTLDEVPAESRLSETARQLQGQLRLEEEEYWRAREAAQEEQNRRGRELLRQALRQGSELQFSRAIALLSQVPSGSSSFESAQVKMVQYRELLKQRQQWEIPRSRDPPPTAQANRPRRAPTRYPAAGSPKPKRPVNWEQWRFQQWKALHERYKVPSPLPQLNPLLRRLPFWPPSLPR